MRTVNKERALAILSPLAVLLVWQAASDAGLVDQRYVPSPIAIAKAGWALALRLTGSFTTAFPEGLSIDKKPVAGTPQLRESSKENSVILVADVDRNGAILAQIVDVLIDEGQRRVSGPFGDYIRLGDTILGGQVKIERRIFRVGRPGSGGGKLSASEERQAG